MLSRASSVSKKISLKNEHDKEKVEETADNGGNGVGKRSGEGEPKKEVCIAQETQNLKKVFLLDRIGGSEVLDCVVDEFLESIGYDDQLNFFFQTTDMKHLATHQKRLLSMAFTKIPDGISVQNVIRGHHQHLFAQGLNEKHFDLVAQHLIAAMEANSINDEAIQEAVGIIGPLRAIFEEGAKQ